MADSDSTPSEPGTPKLDQPLTRLPFPPLKKSHIIHCSYHYWHPRYRPITPKARLIPLTAPFLSYLRADGIILPSETESTTLSDDDSGIFSSTEDPSGYPSSSDEEEEDIAAEWRDVHLAIGSTIAELGGKVVPKLNWSSPKDATWISATNSMECRNASDVYLLLKSSDFVTHDLEHCFDDCVSDDEEDGKQDDEGDVQSSMDTDTKSVPYVLALRKFVQLNPSLEFRVFVRRRKILGISQRDLNHFDFLFALRDKLRDRIEDFFEDKVRHNFPDDNFTFDVYIPPPYNRVWLVDFNPWAIRTDPLLFSWLELLTMDEPQDQATDLGTVVRIPLQSASRPDLANVVDNLAPSTSEDDSDSDTSSSADEDLSPPGPEFRLVNRDDPEAYMFNSTRYSAHKLPKDVVDASQSGAGGLREFADNWRDILSKRQAEDAEVGSSGEE